jgi:hypothetical protein
MQVIHPVCCGIDCHQAQLTVCLRRVSEDGQITTQLMPIEEKRWLDAWARVQQGG